MSDKRIFDSIEEINESYGSELELPENIPYDCNLVCYRVSEGNVDFFALYKETDEGLFSLFKCGWEYSSESLQAEIEFDNDCLVSRYIYVKVNRETLKDKVKDKFTPERLLGVETKSGYVTGLVNWTADGRLVVLLNNRYWYYPESLNFYISDESDETVSYDEYLEMFYER